MKTSRIDKNIKEKLKNRTFTPSASAWERLSVQLDEQPKQKKFGWFFYIGAAASILLLVSVGIQIFSNDVEINVKTKEFVRAPLDKKQINNKIDEFINEIPVSKAIVKQEEIAIEQEIQHPPVLVKHQKKTSIKKNFNKDNSKNETVIAKVDEKTIKTKSNELDEFKSKYVSKENLKQNPNSAIKVNADDLLYAVTHTQKEVKVYYAKYNVNREDVLRTIKNELKKSNLTVNPNTILAEVERNIEDEYFENNFMKSLKKRVSTIAVAIASRNN